MFHFIQYIAENNPDAAANLCYDYGMQPQDVNDLAHGLTYIIDQEGAIGLRSVLELHPDKNVILENFTGAGNYKNANGGSCNSGGCGNCKLSSMLVKSNNANGGASTMAPQYYPNPQTTQNNNLVIVGIISLTIVAGLIIHKNNN